MKKLLLLLVVLTGLVAAWRKLTQPAWISKCPSGCCSPAETAPVAVATTGAKDAAPALGSVRLVVANTGDNAVPEPVAEESVENGAEPERCGAATKSGGTCRRAAGSCHQHRKAA